MGYRLRIPAQIGDWLADLRDTEPGAAAEVGATVVALLDAGQVTGQPFVRDPDTAEADPREVLDASYQELLGSLQFVRRRVADVSTDRRRAELRLAALRDEADHDPAKLDALQRQAADAEQREQKLTLQSERLQAAVNAFRTRREVLKASYTAAEGQARAAEAMEELDKMLAQADGPRDEERAEDQANADSQAGSDREGTASAETVTASAETVTASAETVTASAETTTSHTTLRPDPAAPQNQTGAARRPPLHASSAVLELAADPLGANIRILFAVEPQDTVTVLTVLEGGQAIRDSWAEAAELAGQLLAEIRAENPPSSTSEAGQEWLEFAGATTFLQMFFADQGDAIAVRARELARSETLAKLREGRGMSLKDLAIATGIHESRLAAIERNGAESADVMELAACLRQLGCMLELTAVVDGERRGLS